MKAKFAIGRAIVVGSLCLATGASRPAASTFPNDDKAIVHVLNRIGFGPRPGDVERVRRTGVQRYIEQQLYPERMADAAMQERLAALPTTALSSREIAEQYALPALQAKRDRKQELKADEGTAPSKRPDRQQQPANLVLVELSQQKVLRAAYSERQLEEVLVDFWFNHFNVDARKGPDRFLLTEYERETIRPHVLGSFRDLLGATAKSPAMLFYLDNWMSASATAPAADARQDVSARRRAQMADPRSRRGRLGAPAAVPRPNAAAQKKNAPKGLNENYGRELMELHTLGVDGGYTQQDVTEVARAFTGWTIEQPRQGGAFRFEPRIHDAGEKVVLGHRIKAGGGIDDGEQVLDVLATHPSTAHFIATKLVRRFVSDTPPAALVDRAAARFTETGGNLREVMRTVLTSPEFLAPDAYRSKVKSPLEFVVSAVRATRADVANAVPLVRALQQLGMPLYQCQPPTGYRDAADAWVNSGALVGRMNFALQLASNTLPGVSVPDGEPVVDTALHGDVTDTTRATIAKATDRPQMTALTLGAPEFQRK